MKEERTNRRTALTISACILVVLLAVHFALITLYSFRDSLPDPRMSHMADRYAIPAFHQNWKLFAPDLPAYNVEMEYRWTDANGWGAWKDVSSSFGFGKTSRIETIEQGFNSALGWQVLNNFYSKDGRAQFDRLVQSPAYASALYFVVQMHRKFHSEIPQDSLQLRLNFRFTPPPDKAYTFQTTVLEFPVFNLATGKE